MGNLGKIGKPQKSKKHKKLKQCDPFYKGPKNTKINDAEKDKKPKNSQLDDQEMTRSMKEFMRMKQMMKENLANPQLRKKKKLKDGKINDFQIKDDRKGMTRPVRKVPEFHRRKGETDRRFVARAETAARNVIGESRFEDKYQLNENPTEVEVEEKAKRKEEWRKKKAEKTAKRKKKRKVVEGVSEMVDRFQKKNAHDLGSKPTRDFGDLRDDVQFGEVAMAPPSLPKPRKAEAGDRRDKSSLLLNSMLKSNDGNDKTGKKTAEPSKKSKGKSLNKSAKLRTLSALQKSNLLKERQKAVDQYRKLKAGKLGKLNDSVTA